jgi:PEGA domain
MGGHYSNGHAHDARSVTGLRLALVLLTGALLAGCATVINGTTQTIPIASDPPAADVIVDGSTAGQTPTKVVLKRNADHLVTLQKAGYEPTTLPIVKDVGGTVWGNVLVGGLVGWGVDATSGAQYKLVPSTVSVTLAPVSTTVTGLGANDSADFVGKLKALDLLHGTKQVSDDEYLRGRVELFRRYMPQALPADSSPQN